MPKLPAKKQNNQKLTKMQEDFISHLFTSKTTKEAARKAGYSNSTSDSAIYTMLHKPHIQAKIIQEYQSRNAGNIPVLAQIESKIFRQVLAKPSRYREYKEVFKQAKQHAGLLSDDHAPARQTIAIENIESVQVIMSDIISKRLQDLKEDNN